MEIFLPKYIDYNFTAEMEESLDKIANGEIDWESFIVKFYENLKKDEKDIHNISIFSLLEKMNPSLQKWIKNMPCASCGKPFKLYIKNNLFFCCPDCKAILGIKEEISYKDREIKNKFISKKKKSEKQEKE